MKDKNKTVISYFLLVPKSFKEFLVSQKIIDLLINKEFKHPLISKRGWTREIIDFVYDSELFDKSRTSRNRIPSLLQFSDEPIFLVQFKCFLFRLLASFDYSLVVLFDMSKMAFQSRSRNYEYNRVTILRHGSFKIVIEDEALEQLSIEPNSEMSFFIKAYFIAITKNQLDPVLTKRILSHLVKYY